jgi:hypothetical protein
LLQQQQQKAQEQALVQLNEQLQLNLLQQSQLVQDKKTNGKQTQQQLQQLALQQQQIVQQIQQIQLQQRQLLLACLMQPYTQQQGKICMQYFSNVWWAGNGRHIYSTMGQKRKNGCHKLYNKVKHAVF